MKNTKLVQLTNQILSQLPKGSDPKTDAIRSHVEALAGIFERGETSSDTSDLSAPSIPAQDRSARPGMFTERRARRQNAGVSLRQVAEIAHTTMPTARMYEAKRTAVRPDKRQALDAVYEQFKTVNLE